MMIMDAYRLLFAGFDLVILLLLYVIIKMIWNRLNGKDELDGIL
ncbi:MAG: hypothetical protein JWR23_1563 [Mucilaginibacter sp.]|nr:hypothetical protein [Mucilaginibacter sp.]